MARSTKPGNTARPVRRRSGDTVQPARSKTEEDATTTESRPIEIPRSIAVRQLAELLQVDAIQLIKQLMRIGILANINQVISYEVAANIATSYEYEARLKPEARRTVSTGTKVKKRQQAESTGNLQPRPPIVTVMGHVDHGKTRLLDAIRKTNVMDTEAGNITQHIGAYQVKVNEQKVTFLDTPGHEAFTAMRAHGADITDITVLVVAADDGVMPQTLEAINHARAAGVPIMVAINKIDKDNANPDRVKQQLADAGLVIEEWGGDTICVQISAKENIGITELLENLLIMAEMEELKADPSQPASGVVIEAEMDKLMGPLATVLIQTGTLKIGDTIVVGTTWGRVRAMLNYTGKRVKKAEPATPVAVLGLNSVPQVGDMLVVVTDERHAQALVARNQKEAQLESSQATRAVSLSNLYDQISTGRLKELNVIIKTDVQGSIEPIRSSLEQVGTEEVKVRIIHSGTGGITESDVMLAIASKGLIIGFGVNSEEGARRLASVRRIDIRYYNIIYNLVDDVQKALKGMLEPTYVEVVEGLAEVRAVFPAGKGIKAAGAYVTQGKISRNSSVRVRRAGEALVESTVSSLRRFKDDVREVAAGYECGIGVKGFGDFQVGDVLEFYKMEKSE